MTNRRSTPDPRRRVLLRGISTCCVSALILASCGDDDSTAPDTEASAAGVSTDESPQTEASDTSAGATASSPAASGSVAPYSGPESELPPAYPEPEVQDGFTFTVGLLNSTTAQPGLAAWQAAAEARTAELGGTMTALATNIDVEEQVDQFAQLIAQDVDAIIVNPIAADALTPQLERAAEAGIPVFGVGMPAIVEDPPSDAVVTNAVEGFDQKAYYPIAQIAADFPGTTFAIEGFGIPVPQLQYQAEQIKKYGEELGLEFVDQVDAAGDSASQYADAATTILTRNPDLGALICFNDSCAQAAASVVRQSDGDTKVTGVNGDPDAVAMVESGQIYATAKVGYEELGIQNVNAVYNYLTEQNLPLPQTVAIPVTIITGDT